MAPEHAPGGSGRQPQSKLYDQCRRIRVPVPVQGTHDTSTWKTTLTRMTDSLERSLSTAEQPKHERLLLEHGARSG